MNEMILYILVFIIPLVVIVRAIAANIPAEISRRIKEYDPDFDLVYESILITDWKMQDVKLKSYLIIEINNTHNYQFSR